MKNIVFFDGDGTLWYPKATKYEIPPVWVYHSPETAKDPNRHLELTPTALSTIKQLKSRGVYLAILSANPRPPEEANAIMQEKVRHFRLQALFDEVHATQAYAGSKGEFMLDILKRTGFPKGQALMVGDHYEWDYKPAQDRGIDALLIESGYRKTSPGAARIRRVIRSLKDVLDHIS